MNKSLLTLLQWPVVSEFVDVVTPPSVFSLHLRSSTHSEDEIVSNKRNSIYRDSIESHAVGYLVVNNLS